MVATAGVVNLALITSSEGLSPSRSRKSSLQKERKTMMTIVFKIILTIDACTVDV